jgi:hypothetical protein
MNEAISNVARTQSSNPAKAGRLEQETFKSAEQIAGGQNNATETSVSSKYDTLDLSREYLKYKTQGGNAALSDQTSQLNATVIEYAAAANRKRPIYNYQLYAYNDLELLEMLNKGEITPEEYKKEMADREGPEFREEEAGRFPSK